MSDDQAPPARRIRSSPPDLEIIVGEGENQKTYHHYSIILAHQSPFIDAKLASPLIADKSRVEFPDVPPEDWELMAEFLDIGGTPTRDLSETFRLARWFHKYDFTFACKACDQRIREICFDSLEWKDDPITLKNALDKLYINIQALQVAYLCQLATSQEKGDIWLVHILSSMVATQLTVNYVKMLIPVLMESEVVWNVVSMILGKEISDVESRSSLIQSSLFPHMFVMKLKNRALQEEVGEWMQSSYFSLTVRGAHIAEANGSYKRRILSGEEFPCFIKQGNGYSQPNFAIVLEEGGSWSLLQSDLAFPQAVVGAGSTVLYENSAEEGDPRPPMFGWVDPDYRLTDKCPVVEYEICAGRRVR